ncbi:SAM-dependent methyltransferase [Tabrizicola oligotrophica]|uniref:Methyltransferase domain-containing protein n=1 Tax=Tabrizicola oligotrophica TaxID=2710650 RepID=A0A6M0QYN7_9RHOB|nr:class I SAM-dependent methyltransferase [Tabrizicola oligotrophica]NEY91973.1 methyltransferase domain-containing protein [Tabrizicola oligotrophica]
MWDERYKGKDYLFGTEPAAFVAREAGVLAPGSRVLCLADGEGRNSVHLAGLGHRVTAMEPSGVALDKARALAGARGVVVEFRQSGVETWDWSRPFDAALGVFIQFAPPALRAAIHAGIARAVVPGGLVLLHGYAPRQIANGTGGPRAVENLYTLDQLRADFPGWEVLRAADYDAEIHEGTGHAGRSALVDFIARKLGAPA